MLTRPQVLHTHRTVTRGSRNPPPQFKSTRCFSWSLHEATILARCNALHPDPPLLLVASCSIARQLAAVTQGSPLRTAPHRKSSLPLYEARHDGCPLTRGSRPRHYTRWQVLLAALPTHGPSARHTPDAHLLAVTRGSRPCHYVPPQRSPSRAARCPLIQVRPDDPTGLPGLSLHEAHALATTPRHSIWSCCASPSLYKARHSDYVPPWLQPSELHFEKRHSPDVSHSSRECPEAEDGRKPVIHSRLEYIHSARKFKKMIPRTMRDYSLCRSSRCVKNLR